MFCSASVTLLHLPGVNAIPLSRRTPDNTPNPQIIIRTRFWDLGLEDTSKSGQISSKLWKCEIRVRTWTRKPGRCQPALRNCWTHNWAKHARGEKFCAYTTSFGDFWHKCQRKVRTSTFKSTIFGPDTVWVRQIWGLAGLSGILWRPAKVWTHNLPSCNT